MSTAGDASPLQFPTDFPIKIMGRRVDGFADAIAEVVRRHAPGFDPATLQMRPSREGTWLGLTATIRATSREQLDALYRELSAHPMVKVVL
jgi:putative lipoic acid-binding regulatory protein